MSPAKIGVFLKDHSGLDWSDFAALLAWLRVLRGCTAKSTTLAPLLGTSMKGKFANLQAEAELAPFSSRN